jgi:hypothetical protein
MTGSALLKRLATDGEDAVEMRPVQPAGELDGEGFTIGPANAIIAGLTRAIAEEPSGDERLATTPEDDNRRWPLRKSVAVLFAGCGLFWLVAYLTLTAVV